MSTVENDTFFELRKAQYVRVICPMFHTSGESMKFSFLSQYQKKCPEHVERCQASISESFRNAERLEPLRFFFQSRGSKHIETLLLNTHVLEERLRILDELFQKRNLRAYMLYESLHVSHDRFPLELLNRCHQIWPERTQICREFFSDPRTSNRRSVAQTVLEIFNFYSTHPTVDFALKSVMWFSDEHGVSRKKLLSSWKFHRSYTTTCATKQDHPELDSSCGSGTVDGASCQSSSSEKLCVTQPSGLKFSGWLLDT